MVWKISNVSEIQKNIYIFESRKLERKTQRTHHSKAMKVLLAINFD